MVVSFVPTGRRHGGFALCDLLVPFWADPRIMRVSNRTLSYPFQSGARAAGVHHGALGEPRRRWLKLPCPLPKSANMQLTVLYHHRPKYRDVQLKVPYHQET